jgi:hypothetical protein
MRPTDPNATQELTDLIEDLFDEYPDENGQPIEVGTESYTRPEPITA